MVDTVIDTPAWLELRNNSYVISITEHPSGVLRCSSDVWSTKRACNDFISNFGDFIFSLSFPLLDFIVIFSLFNRHFFY